MICLILNTTMFHCTTPFIISHPSSGYDLNNVERDVKLQIIIYSGLSYFRYNNGQECGGKHCMDLNYKEHYHCIDCNFHVFIKKEEMVRHYKWHRKREESLQHGFLRFSPLDNCTKRFGPCTHNGRQTHYHCLQVGRSHSHSFVYVWLQIRCFFTSEKS